MRTAVEPVTPGAAAEGRTYVRLRVVDRNGSPVAGATITPSLSIELQRSHAHVADTLTPAALASAGASLVAVASDVRLLADGFAAAASALSVER